ncbi:CPBP family intramembrane glutamic endopeptidase [Natrialbaceae archaeon A-CW3]
MESNRQSGTSQYRASLVAIALTITAFIVSILIGLLVMIPAVLIGYDIFSLEVLVASLIAGQVGFLAVGLLYVRRYELEVPITWPTSRSLGIVVGGTILALGLAIGGQLLLEVLDLLPESVIEETAEIDPVFFLILAALSIVLVAPAEEFLFRGVIQGRLRQSFGSVGAVLGSSLLFGMMHLPNYTGSLAEILMGGLLITIVGVVFGALYEYTENLTVPIAIHAIYNTVLLVSAYALF